MGYKRDEVIAEFVGDYISQEEYMRRCDDNPAVRAYGVVSSEFGNVLSCYEYYKQGLCLASLANCPKGLFNFTTMAKARANARFCVDSISKRVTIRAGLVKPSRSAPNFYIPRHTEILIDYGTDYNMYDFDSHL